MASYGFCKPCNKQASQGSRPASTFIGQQTMMKSSPWDYHYKAQRFTAGKAVQFYFHLVLILFPAAFIRSYKTLLNQFFFSERRFLTIFCEDVSQYVGIFFQNLQKYQTADIFLHLKLLFSFSKNISYADCKNITKQKFMLHFTRVIYLR